MPKEWNGFTSQVAVAMVPDEVKDAVTFRCIYEACSKRPLQFLGDRQAEAGDTCKLRKRLQKDLPHIQKACAAAALAPSSDALFEYRNKDLVFKGTPNGSYGYMYCATWLEVPDASTD